MNTRPFLAPMLGLAACTLAIADEARPTTPAAAQAAAASSKLIVSGFGPFAGRPINGSYVLAKSVAEAHPAFEAVEIPVIWGAPGEARKEHKGASFWLAFGEGTSVFRIEIQADNRRGAHADVSGRQPSEPLIVSGAPAQLRSPLPATEIAEALTSKGFPTVVSTDAGNYLCEEMLFTLLATQKKESGDGMFVHIPVLGRTISLPDGSQQKVTREWLAGFGKALVEELSAQKLIPAPRS